MAGGGIKKSSGSGKHGMKRISFLSRPNVVLTLGCCHFNTYCPSQGARQ